jgi:N-acetylneuraminic acid mutarotase
MRVLVNAVFGVLLFSGLLLVFPSGVRGAEEASGWRTLATETKPTQRHENAYVRVGDKFYLVGGRGERPVEMFDPATGEWHTRATPPISLHHFQAVAYEGKIYVIGALSGGFPDEDPVANVYIYDPQADAWTKGPKIPADRRRGAAGAVAHDGQIYVVGGIQNGHLSGQVRWFDAFDPQTGEWTELANAPRRRDHFHAAVIDGKLYAAGGRRTSHATGEVFDLTIPEVDVYDFESESWRALGPSGDLPTERAGSTTTAVGRYLIVLGGESGAQGQAHAEVEAYDTRSGEWQSLPSLNQGRHGTQVVRHDGKLYLAAGSSVRGAREINSQEVLPVKSALEALDE